MIVTIDWKLVFTALGLVISVVSLRMAFLARREAKETALLDLVHKKRMLLSDNFSDICRVVRILISEQFQDDKTAASYKRLREYRDKMIEEMNKSSEMDVDCRKLDKKTLLNQISDFNLMHAIHKSDLVDLQEYINIKSVANKAQHGDR